MKKPSRHYARSALATLIAMAGLSLGLASPIGADSGDFYDEETHRPACGSKNIIIIQPSDPSNKAVYGTSGDDCFIGDNRSNIMVGGRGDDLFFGGGGGDYLVGQAGNDILYGGAGNDFIYGGFIEMLPTFNDGDDIGYGGPGDDWLFGGTGNDTVYGEAGDDSIRGGYFVGYRDVRDGNDVLHGGSGTDSIGGGTGADQLFGADNNSRVAQEKDACYGKTIRRCHTAWPYRPSSDFGRFEDEDDWEFGPIDIIDIPF